ncbi:MAG TPA: hypothetical protein DCQ64_09290, partial [Candidatus Rokubacteria bacterium]|nr:hypothetical protein [Candidatus Rokubacteria bacterium]
RGEGDGPMKIEITHRVSGAVLFGVEAESWRCAVEIAVKQDANLRDADLGGADLLGANLWGANLRDTDLWSANLRGTRVLAVAFLGHIDGWATTLWRTDQGYRIQAGCHMFTLDEATAHYADRADRRGLYYLATEAWRVIARLQGWEPESS